MQIAQKRKKKKNETKIEQSIIYKLLTGEQGKGGKPKLDFMKHPHSSHVKAEEK